VSPVRVRVSPSQEIPAHRLLFRTRLGHEMSGYAPRKCAKSQTESQRPTARRSDARPAAHRGAATSTFRAAWPLKLSKPRHLHSGPTPPTWYGSRRRCPSRWAKDPAVARRGSKAQGLAVLQEARRQAAAMQALSQALVADDRITVASESDAAPSEAIAARAKAHADSHDAGDLTVVRRLGVVNDEAKRSRTWGRALMSRCFVYADLVKSGGRTASPGWVAWCTGSRRMCDSD
jgi:hypothetical protein